MTCYVKDKAIDAVVIRNEMLRMMMIGEKAILDQIRNLDVKAAEKTVIVMNAYKSMFVRVMTACGAEITDKEGYLKPADGLKYYRFLEGNEFWESFRDQCVWDNDRKVWITPEHSPAGILLSEIFDDHCHDCMFWVLENKPCCLCEVKSCDPNDRVCSRFCVDKEAEESDEDGTEQSAEEYYDRQNRRRREYWESLGSPIYPPEDVPMARMRTPEHEERIRRLREKDKESKK
jgi:hypothetical protein